MSEPSGVFWGGLLATGVFYALIFVVGWRASRNRAGQLSEMLLAGRAMPLWMAALTMSATWVGGGYINGSAESAYASGIVWVQAPWGYALSLVIGGLVFAPVMRSHGFTTMLDPLHARFGRRTAAMLYVPALTGELFWSAAILTALGTTFATVLGLDVVPSILLSATIAILYTLIGGLWAVAATDVVQLGLLLIGLAIVAPVAATSVGGIGPAWSTYAGELGEMARLLPPWDGWRRPEWGPWFWNWWDSALLLIFGGIPWHVYFQRVLASRDPATARRLSLSAAAICLLAAVPAVLIGVVARTADWTSVGATPPPEPAMALPWVLRYLTPPWIGAIGLGAIAAAVMSSVDSSILSAAAMGTWNVYRPLRRPDAGDARLVAIVRRCILLVGVAATLIALRVSSVYALWFLCSDFVYCILFPQLTAALFDPRANRTGSMAGLAVSFALRFGGGEPVLGLPRLIPYPLVDPASGTVLFPFRTLAMVAGLATIVVVSRMTAHRDPPRGLNSAEAATDTG
jgi:high affinity choline transporter 7